MWGGYVVNMWRGLCCRSECDGGYVDILNGGGYVVNLNEGVATF